MQSRAVKEKYNNRYYLMRHGESLANRRGLIVSDPINALTNYGLTPLGAEQVTQVALQTRLGRDTLVICSDFKRARETAEIIHSVVDLECDIEFEMRLRERFFGNWELKDHSNYEHIWYRDLTQPNQQQGGVETVQDVLKRVSSVIHDLEKRYDGETILLVGHGDVLQILLAQHHGINSRFHRSLNSIGNADIRSLAVLELSNKGIA